MTAPAPGSQSGDRFERTWVLREEREAIERVQGDVGRALHEHGFGEAATFAIRLALEEALVNGFRHGKFQPDRHCHANGITYTHSHLERQRHTQPQRLPDGKRHPD